MDPKDFLKKQASIPEAIENQLPPIAPKFSKILVAIADALPSISSPTGSKSKTSKVREFVRYAEEKVAQPLSGIIHPKETVVVDQATITPRPVIITTKPSGPASGGVYPEYGGGLRRTTDITRTLTGDEEE